MKIDKITPQIAALYLGQMCENSAGSVYTVSNTDILSLCSDAETWRKLTLHLRRLDSITEDEARELYKIKLGKNWEARPEWLDDSEPDFLCLDGWWNSLEDVYQDESMHMIGAPEVWLYLLSKGFDLFGLIDAGLAKDVSQKSQSK